VVLKGEHPLTEHYSALEAEVPDPVAPASQLNGALLRRLDQADTLLVAGQAASHCVRATVEHLVMHLPSGRPERLLLLSDAMSPVAGFEADAAAFAADMAARGVRRATCADWLAAAG
jgi:nicotinamidase-related amidase